MCVRMNPENGKCKAEEAPVGHYGCTGYSPGDLCELECPVNYKSEQYGHVLLFFLDFLFCIDQ